MPNMTMEEKRVLAAKTCTRLTNAERLEGQYRVDVNGCWIWIAHRDKKDYGRTHWYEGRKRISGLAHRLSYIVHIGEVPPTLQLDHLCRVHACINPLHLEPVTQRENVLRGIAPQAINARKTHCPKGHEYDENNTYKIVKGNATHRICRICQKERHAKSKSS